MINMNNGRKRYIWIASMLCALLAVSSCGEKKGEDRFSAPAKTYAVWVETAVKGDFVTNMECITRASMKFMDGQAKHRTEFMERMVEAAKIFNKYIVVDENIKGDKAVVVIREPESGDSVAVPFQYEDGGWKVDLIAMFSGIVKGSN